MYTDMTTTQYQIHRRLRELWNVCKWACDDELRPTLITVPSSQRIKRWTLNSISNTHTKTANYKKNFQEYKLNFRRFPVFPGVVDTPNVQLNKKQLTVITDW